VRQPVTEATDEDVVVDALRTVFVHPRRELARRISGGSEVTLYWSTGDNSTSVEVFQPSSGETLLFTVAGEHALDAFYHPFAHLLPHP
jgi:hypothetical protein